ncbi:hypothetical protein RJ640_010337, partial [Escallonia rubra]
LMATTLELAATMLLLLSLSSNSLAYRPGDIVPMSRMGQYHSSRTVWHDMIGRHCPIFAVNREVLIPIPKPTGYTGADPYKVSFQVGREKFFIPWLLLINRKSSEVPMIIVHLRYSGTDFLGVTAEVVDMPHHLRSKGQDLRKDIIIKTAVSIRLATTEQEGLDVAINVDLHPDIRKQFWDQEHWPKHVLVRYTWGEQSEIDVVSGFYVLFGSGLLLSFILSIYILQSSRDKLARFVQETVAESSMPGSVVAKVE